MGKYTDFVFDGSIIYFTVKDFNEPFHVHISNKKLTEKGSAKLFIRADGTCKIVHPGIIKMSTIRKVEEYIKYNYMKMFNSWLEAGGPNDFYRG